MIENSFELYLLLQKQELLKEKPFMWWPSYGKFEVLVGAILTQNSQWKRVEISLNNLRVDSLLELESFCKADIQKIQTLISPSGLYKSKAKYLKFLASAIQAEFKTFENFCDEVDREWLLEQKGVGTETADSILCYACKQSVMVVDAYTARLVNSFGYEFERYEDLQSWCKEGLSFNFHESRLHEAYALFHGMIVEYVKSNSKGKKVDVEPLLRA